MQALLRLSPEITTKAHNTRKRFTKRTAENLRLALRENELEGTVRPEHARIYLEYADPAALSVARRVFGVHSVSPAHEMEWVDVERLYDETERLVADSVKGKTFAVRARVVHDAARVTGQQINEELGRRLCAYARVNLDEPDVTVRIEIRHGRVHVYTSTLRGEGGMPVTVGGRAITLLSAGYDSAVAAWLMMRRGVHVEFVTCRIGGEAHERAVIAVANRLVRMWAPGIRARIAVVPFEEHVERIRRDVWDKYAQLVLKRLMYRTAEQVCKLIRADVIVTGESIGQVSSQTLRNLRSLSIDTPTPVMRPLLGHSKIEIMELAKRVGTHHLSSGVPEYCALGARPATGASQRDVAEQEAKIPFDAEHAARFATWYELPTELPAERESLCVGSVPAGAVVLDLRTPSARKAREIPGARAVDALALIHQPQLLEAEASYIVVCDEGHRSAWLAKRLRELGFDAFALRRP